MFLQKEKKSVAVITRTCVFTLMLAAVVAALTVTSGCTNLNQSRTGNGRVLDRLNVPDLQRKSAEDKAYEYASYLQFGNESEQKNAIKNMAILLCSHRPGMSKSKTVATQSLIYAVHSDQYTSNVRKRAAKALREAKDENSRNALINALGTVRDGKVRREVATSLGKMHDPKSVKYLEYALLNDPDKNVRVEAAASLARIGDSSCIPSLLKAAQNDSDSYVRWRAENALNRWLPPTGCETMMSYPRYRRSRTFSFGNLRILTRGADPLSNPAEVKFNVKPVYKPSGEFDQTHQENGKDRLPVFDGLMVESPPGLGPF